MPEKLNENQLVKACLDGDSKAQKFLFESLGKKMMAVCMRYARNRQEAEDMLQDGWVRVFTQLHTFSFQGPLEAWIRRVIVNSALRRIGKKSYQNESIGIPDHMDTPISETAISNLREEELLNYINMLPVGYKTVFNLYVIEGYSHREISEMLECGESTSRSQLVKAKKMLKKIILSNEKIAV
ncbi:MAG: RNA polymerase sigma factor [Saprospiraceae bacterium]|nr:RNA polymerase sigma factor [Saprospiraceae bacterium]